VARGVRGKAVRPGVTLLEVVISLAILLFSSAAIFSLVQMGSDRAIDVQFHARASMLCQSKLEELKIGSEPLNSTDFTPFKEKEASAYQYSLDVSDGDMTGIKNVKVTVKRERADGRLVEVTLNQMILDPAIRGGTFDKLNASSSTPPSSSTPSSNTPSSNTPSTKTPSSNTPSTPPATTPSKGPSSSPPSSSPPSRGAPSKGGAKS
jgi:hypothetical protein